jgi:hypothetical protein
MLAPGASRPLVGIQSVLKARARVSVSVCPFSSPVSTLSVECTYTTRNTFNCRLDRPTEERKRHALQVTKHRQETSREM